MAAGLGSPSVGFLDSITWSGFSNMNLLPDLIQGQPALVWSMDLGRYVTFTGDTLFDGQVVKYKCQYLGEKGITPMWAERTRLLQ